METLCPIRSIWLNPMNLSTFSEMKRILPSSARRKKKPSMDSRCGRPSKGTGGVDAWLRGATAAGGQGSAGEQSLELLPQRHCDSIEH